MIGHIIVALTLLQQISAFYKADIVVPKIPEVTMVCNSTHCDDLTLDTWCPLPTHLHVYTTSEAGDRFRHSKGKFDEKDDISSADFKITLNPCKKHQKIIGFGGALSDASALLLKCLSEGTKKNLLDSYFNCKKGIGYNLLRIPLGATDYSLNLYTYNDSPEPDPELTAFALHEMDTDYKIPLAKEAQSASCRKIRLLAGIWRSPSWVLQDRPGQNLSENFLNVLPTDLTGTFVSQVTSRFQNYTKTCIKPEFEETWALYFAKALTEYKKQGINFEWISGGNEVTFAPSFVCWDFDRYQNWITYTLGPKLEENGHADVKLVALDDHTPFLHHWQKMLDNPDTSAQVAGFVTHWYFDYDADYDIVQGIQENYCENYPDKILFSSESSTCHFEPDFFTTSDWHKAEKYAKDIILKLQSCNQGYIDWNIALDHEGGPNFEENYCYSAVEVNCTADEFQKKALFYVLGHFSKFVPEGSVRIESTINTDQSSPNLKPPQVVAFRAKYENCLRPNIILIALNMNEQDVKADVCLTKGKCATIQLPKKSIVSTLSSVPWNYICL